jgi:hypothetical protein
MCYGEYNDFYTETLPVAHKEHECCECHRTISIGEKYENVSGKSEDRFWRSKTCTECLEIRKALVCGSWIFGMLWEEIEELVFPAWLTTSPLDCLAKIDSLEARNLLCNKFVTFQESRRDL